VIIVGAGLGGLSAAWHLTRRRRDLQVEVYDASWVPGGKAVSGRDDHEQPDGRPHLVKEHGLHMLFGTYRETWRMLSDCYEALLGKRPVDHVFRRIEQAFTPQGRIVFDERDPSHNARRHWVFCPEPAPGRPWDTDGRVDGSGDLDLIRTSVRTNIEEQSRSLFTTAIELFGPAVRRLETPRRIAVDACAADLAPLRGWLEQIAGLCVTPRASSLFLSRPRLTLSQVLRLATSARRIVELIDLASAILDGTRELMNDCTCRQHGRRCDCLDKLNSQDLREWLKKHGWHDENDAIVRGFYAGLFALEGELAAGVGLRAMLRVLFDYEGALVYRMQSGMGEVVVAPIYQALRKRNVRFHFLERLTKLEVADRRVTRLHFERLGQLGTDYEPFKTLQTLHGVLEYFPTTPPKGARLPTPPRGEKHGMHRRWPTKGTGEPVAIGRGDWVILAIPPQVLKRVASALKAHAPWRAFLNGPTATASRPIAAAQIWQTKPPDCPAHRIRGAVAAGHQPPLEVWADTSHVLSYEGFPHEAYELDYLCGPRPGSSAVTQDAELLRVDAEVDSWLMREGKYMLGRTFDRSLEAERYIAASLEPSDQYVLSLPGTIAHRIRPDNTGFTNLRVAGDWVKNGLDCGCVESAVTGGRMAAESIP
jgi:uncharacterized protein with NAD-binding domain and iron-sulfur cluster